jgi:hypothetical protein
MSAEAPRLQPGFPAPPVCTKILLEIILAFGSDPVEQDVHGKEVGSYLFSELPVSTFDTGTGAGP